MEKLKIIFINIATNNRRKAENSKQNEMEMEGERERERKIQINSIRSLFPIHRF